MEQKITITCLADTHNQLYRVNVPETDILTIAGDFCVSGNIIELEKFRMDLEKLPHKHKIIVPGNHDCIFETHEHVARDIFDGIAEVLIDESIVVEGIKFYGSPWTPRFCDWAYNADPHELPEIWEKIPEDTQVLLTHGPAKTLLDQTFDNRSVGCPFLKHRIKALKNLLLHSFGHVHHSYGVMKLGPTIVANSSICNERYQPTNPPWVFQLYPESNYIDFLYI